MKENLPSTRALESFKAFETLNDPQLVQMKQAAQAFLDDLRNNKTPRWLSFLGTSGAGKTMLTKIIYRYYRDHFHDRVNWPATNGTVSNALPYGRIIRHRGGFINWGQAINERMLKGEYDFLSDVASWPFFAIDDIGSEYQRHRDLSAAKLYNVLESRLGKWTVITANLSLTQINDSLDARIASRMIRGGSVVIDVDVPDFNLRRRAA